MARQDVMVELPGSTQSAVSVEVASSNHVYWLMLAIDSLSALDIAKLFVRTNTDLILQLPVGTVQLSRFFEASDASIRVVIKRSNDDLEVLSLNSQVSQWLLHSLSGTENGNQFRSVSFDLPDPVWDFIGTAFQPDHQEAQEPGLLWWHYASCGVALASGVYFTKETVADDDLVLSGLVIESSIAERHDLMVSVVDVDGATLGGQYEIAPDGSFDGILPRQSGVVIFIASSAGESSSSSSDFLSASVESPLEGSLYAMRVLDSADGEAKVTINLLTTWAFHLAQQHSEREGLPFDAELVEASYKNVAELMWLAGIERSESEQWIDYSEPTALPDSELAPLEAERFLMVEQLLSKALMLRQGRIDEFGLALAQSLQLSDDRGEWRLSDEMANELIAAADAIGVNIVDWVSLALDHQPPELYFELPVTITADEPTTTWRDGGIVYLNSNEPINGLELSDFSVVGGSVIAVEKLTAQRWGLTVEIDAGFDGDAEIRLAANALVDRGLNSNVEPLTLSVAADFLPAVIASASIYSNNNWSTRHAAEGDRVTIDFTVDETLAGLPMVRGLGVESNATQLSEGIYRWSALVNSDTSTGPVDIEINLVDSVGNTTVWNRPASLQSVEIDTTAPLQILNDLAIKNDSGFESDDLLTKFADQSLQASLSEPLAAGERLQLKHNESDWQDISSSLTGSVLNHRILLVEGDNQLSFRVADAANNLGPESEYSVELDQVAPEIILQQLISSNDLANIAGLGDRITLTIIADEPILLPESLLIAGAKAELQRLADNSFSASVIIDDNFANGLVGYEFALTDRAGNISQPRNESAADSIIIDSSAPIALLQEIVLSSDTGSSSSDALTNTAEQTVSARISVTLEEGEQLQFSLNSQAWVTATDFLTNSQFALPVILREGVNQLAWRVVDIAGNLGAVTSYNAELDTTASSTTAGSFALSADSGSSDSDHLTKTAEQNLLATLSAELAVGDHLELQRDSGEWVDITSSVSGTAVSHALTLNDGDNTFAMRVVDAAGNLGRQTNYSAELDTTSPNITAGSFALSADSGTSDSDHLTKTAGQNLLATLSAELATGDRLELQRDSGEWVDITSSVSGTAVSHALTLNDGDNAFAMRVVDAAGNLGAATSYNAELDTTASTITAGSFALSTDSGSSDSDHLTKTAEQNLLATLSAKLATGDRLELQRDSGEWMDITSSVTGTAVSHALTLNDGDNAFAMRVVDAAGNLGSQINYSAELDTTASTITADSFALSADSGTSDSDHLTKTAEQNLLAKLTAELATGDRLELQRDSGEWVDITSSVSGTAVSHALTLNDGDNAFAMRVVDAAGNLGSQMNYSAELDTTASTITADSFALSADSGTSDSDHLTKTAGQNLLATLSTELAVGDRLELQRDSGGWTDITSSVAGTAVSHALTLNDGDNAFAMRVVDAAGNLGAVTSYNAELDTTASSITAGSFALSADTGTDANDHLTQTAEQNLLATLTAELATGDRLELQRDSGEWVDITSSVSGTAVSHALTLNDGDNAFAMRVVDAAGNLNTQTSYSAELERAAPLITNISIATTDADATAKVGDTIELLFSLNEPVPEASVVTIDGALVTPVLATLSDSRYQYSASYTVVESSSEGSVEFSVVATDFAGNISLSANATTDSSAVVIDVTPPAAGTLSFVDLEDTGRSDSDAITSDNNFSLQLAGAEPGALVDYQISTNGTTWAATTSAQLELATRTTPYHYRALVTDAAGNETVSNSLEVTIDITASNNTLQPGIAAPKTYNGSTKILDVDIEPLSTGGYIAVYSGNYSGSDTVYLQEYDHGGTAIGSRIALPGQTSGSSKDDIVVIELPNNQLAITYGSYLYSSNKGAFHLSIYDYESGLRTASYSSFNTTDNEFTPQGLFSFDSGSSVNLLVNRIQPAAAYSAIDYSFLDLNDAASMASSTDVHSLGAVTQGAQKIADDGSYVAIVSNKVNARSTSTLNYDTDLVIYDGSTLSKIQLNSNTGYQDGNIALLAGGERLVVTWNEYIHSYYQRFTLAGEAVGSPVRLTSTGSFNQKGQIVALEDGGFAIYWQSSAGLHLQFFDAVGATKTAIIDVFDVSSYSYPQIITTGESTTVVVAWYDNVDKLSYLQRFDSDGNPLGEPSSLFIAPAELEALPNGEFVVTQTYTTSAVGDRTLVHHFLADGTLLQPSDAVFSSDTGRFTGDLVTSVAAQTISLELAHSLATGEWLLGSLDGGATWTNLNEQLTEKVLSWAVTLPASGTLQLKTVDSAGNETLLVDDPYSVDSSAPTVVITDISLSDDNGPSSSDLITNIARQVITATLSAELSASEILYGSVDAGETWRLITDAVDGTAVSWSVGATLDGASSIQLKVVDVAGNEGAVASADYQLVASDVDTSVVVFDLVNGASSSHSDRSFDSAVEYTIYLLVDSDQSILNASGSEWVSWSGGDSLSANDRVIIVGDTGAIDIADNYTFAGLADGDHLVAQTDQFGLKVGSNSTAEHLLLDSTGKLTRRMAYTSVASAQLWSGQAVFATPAAAAQYLSAIPDGLLTSQGLS